MTHRPLSELKLLWLSLSGFGPVRRLSGVVTAYLLPRLWFTVGAFPLGPFISIQSLKPVPFGELPAHIEHDAGIFFAPIAPPAVASISR